MKHLIFWIIIGILSYATYKTSDTYIEREFVVIEKNKEDLQLVYLENTAHKTYTVSESEFIDTEINDTFKVEKYKPIFWILLIITVFILVIYLGIITGGDIDLSDLLETLF